MARGPGSIKGGLTWQMGFNYDPEGRKAGGGTPVSETASLKGGLTHGITNGPYDGRDERRAERAAAKSMEKELYGEGLLGESLAEARGGKLSETFVLPPFSVLNAREGYWQDRKRLWLSLGIQSELGRGENLSYAIGDKAGWDASKADSPSGETALDPSQAAPTPVAHLSPGHVADEPPPEPAPTVPARVVVPQAPARFAMPTVLQTREPARTLKARPPGVTDPVAVLVAPPQPAPAAVPPRRFAAPPILQGGAAKVAAEPRAKPRSAPPAPLVLPGSTWVAPTELPRLQGAQRIAFDVETCDPDLAELGPGSHRGAYVVGFSIARDDERWYFPLRHEGGDNLDPDVVLPWAHHELNGFAGELVGAHLIYDLEMAALDGITFPKVKRLLDIQNAEPLLDENRFSFSLNTLAKDYLGVDQGKDEALLKEAARAHGWTTDDQIKANLWRLPARFVGAYAEADVDRPLRILPLQEVKLAEQDLTSLFDLESRLIRPLLAMRQRGVRVDLNRAEQVRAVLERERDKWLKVVRSYAGPQAELMAPDSFAKALDDRNIHYAKTAKTGKASINKNFFEDNKGDPLVDALACGRRVNTLINTFIDGYVLGHQINGRVYCEFPQLKDDDSGTIARLSSKNPNLQNVPSRKNDNDEGMNLGEDVVKLIRGIFVPEEGELWERHDLSQIEYRYAVHFARDGGDGSANIAREAYNSNPKMDFHALCASLAGMDPEDKNIRKRVKNINFCKLYGGGIEKIASQIGCSVEEAETFVGKYDTNLPFVKHTLGKAKDRADDRGYVTTILKRRGRFDMWEPAGWNDKRPALPRARALAEYGANIRRSRTYAALNRALQGSAADHIKKAMVDIWEAGICNVIGAFLLTVHDELDHSRPETAVALEACAEARHLLESAITLSVPVMAEADVGKNWGEAS